MNSAMLSSYILIALENLKRQRVFSAIKVLSLAIGLGCSMLVLMHVQYANSFDRHIPNWENTYRLVASLISEQRLDVDQSADPYAPQMLLDYPEIEAIARIRPDRGFFGRGEGLRDEEKSRDGENSPGGTEGSGANEGRGASESPVRSDFYWAEPAIFDVFSLDLISGDAATALVQPNAVVLNESTARRYFPDEEALGQILTLTLNGETDLRVTGVMRDLPRNTHLDLDILVSVATGRQVFDAAFMASSFWMSFGGTLTYLTLPNQAEARRISADLPAFVERHLTAEDRVFTAKRQLALFLEPLADIYLSPRTGFAGDGSKRKQMLSGLSLFAVLILLTSCINFANLSLSQLQRRRMEIGIRKALGAKHRQVVMQFLLESLLLTLLALLIVLPLIYVALPVYTALVGMDFTLADIRPDSLLVLLLFVIATGLLSGLVPALALARFQPAIIIKSGGGARRWVRPLVTVLQFGFSASLVLLALAINQQARHLDAMDIGFDKNNLVVLDADVHSASDPLQFSSSLISDLLQHPGIVSVARTATLPPDTGFNNSWSRPGFAPGEFRNITSNRVDEHYIDTLGLRLVAGRNFSSDFPADFAREEDASSESATAPLRAVVMTRSGARMLGFASPASAVGETIVLGDFFPNRIIGVVEDFSLSGGMENTLFSTNILRVTLDPLPVLLIRVDPNQVQAALAHIDSVWTAHRPELPVSRTFYDQTFNDLVQVQTNGISKAALFASAITILISALGLYALAYYSTQRRTREVGIRKVAGATAGRIVSLLTWDFLKPVLLACGLACVAGYFIIDRYFQQFSSRTDISPWLYLLVTLGTLLVALLTVATQCYRAANADPIRSLRYE